MKLFVENKLSLFGDLFLQTSSDSKLLSTISYNLGRIKFNTNLLFIRSLYLFLSFFFESEEELLLFEGIMFSQLKSKLILSSLETEE